MTSFEASPELLRTFLEVFRLGSVTRAAETLYLSQPAVTRRLGRLERSLGLRLFERLGKTLHATEAGEALAREAGELIGNLDRLAESIRAQKVGDRGRLRIGASTTPGLYVLPTLLVQYQAAHPGVEATLSVQNSLRIEQRLLANELDLGFVGAHLSHSALRLRPVFRDTVVLYVGSSHPLAKSRAVTPGDLARTPAIVREPGSATRRLVDGWLARKRITLHRTLEIGCPEAAKPLVRAGLGYAYLSALGLLGPGGAGLSALRCPTFRVERPIFLALHVQKAISPVMERFLEVVARARL